MLVSTIPFDCSPKDVLAIKVWREYVRAVGGHDWENWWDLHCDLKDIQDLCNSYSNCSISFIIYSDTEMTFIHKDTPYFDSPDITIIYDNDKKEVRILKLN